MNAFPEPRLWNAVAPRDVEIGINLQQGECVCVCACVCVRACSIIRKWYELDSGRTFRSSQSPCNYSHVAVIHPLAELSRWFSVRCCCTGSGLDMSLSQSGYLLMSGDISKYKWSKDIFHSVFSVVIVCSRHSTFGVTHDIWELLGRFTRNLFLELT